MNSSAIKRLLVAGILGLALIGPTGGARATLIISAAVGSAPTGANYVNFDSLPLGNSGGVSSGLGVSFTSGDGATVAGALANKYAAPYLSNSNGALFGDSNNGPDTTDYLSTGIGSITLTFSTGQKYLGLLWGSVDDYNSLSFYDGATLVGSVTGTDVWPSANGNQGVNGTFYANINSDVAFDSVVASSTNYAFEFDNVAYDSHDPGKVPEPSTLALLCAGLLGFAALGRMNRSSHLSL